MGYCHILDHGIMWLQCKKQWDHAIVILTFYIHVHVFDWIFKILIYNYIHDCIIQAKLKGYNILVDNHT